MRFVLFFTVAALFTVLAACSGTINEAPEDANGEDEAAFIPWSLLSGRVAYLRRSYGSTYGGHLFIIDSFSREVNLVTHGEGCRFLNTAWGSATGLIVFADYDYDVGFWQLSAIHPDSTVPFGLYPSDGDCNYAAWSSDGRLAYWFDGAEPHAKEIRIDGQPLLSGLECNQTRPAWSPDGRYLVVSMRDSVSQGTLFRVDLRDTTVALLHGAAGEWNEEIFYSPVYSPDGQFIAFTRAGTSVLNQSEIWIMESDGADPVALTSGYYDWYPAWAPDGNSIMFQRGITFASLYLVDLATGETTPITTYEATFPAWVP
jgi:Tol biopolymer transport system component